MNSMDAYRVVREVAPALFGTIFLCVDKSTGLHVAIKRMQLELIQQHKAIHGAEVIDDIEVEKRIYRKINKIGGHQNVLQLMHSFEQHGCEHFVLEYCALGDLFTIVQNSPQKRLNASQVSLYFNQICIGLDFLHKNNIAHGDISLENVLVNDNNVCKLMDFGLAVDSSQGVKPSHPVGKFFYMPPEMYLGVPYEVSKADMWSLGIMLLIMLSGMPPFGRANSSDNAFVAFEVHGIRTLLHGWKIVQHFSPDALDLIEKLLVVNPQQRLSMSEVLNHNYLAKSKTFKSILLKPKEKKPPGNVHKFFQKVFRKASYHRDPSECTVDMDNQDS